MKKFIVCLLFGLLVVAALCFQVGRYSEIKNPNTGSAALQGTPTFVTASSTWYTLTTTSVRILATSSPRRVAAAIQPVNCTTGTTVFLNVSGDVAAVASQGLAAYASSTLQMTDYPELPVVQGSVRAITGVGTCTVLVTEWRTQY